MKQSVYLLNDSTVNDRKCTSYNVDYSWMRFSIINDTWIGEVFFGKESFIHYTNRFGNFYHLRIYANTNLGKEFIRH